MQSTTKYALFSWKLPFVALNILFYWSISQVGLFCKLSKPLDVPQSNRTISLFVRLARHELMGRACAQAGMGVP